MRLTTAEMELMGMYPEAMGVFGLSWPEKVASFMARQLKGTAEAKKLKQFWGAGGKNVTLVKNLHNEYMALMASGYKPSGFSSTPNSSGQGGTFDQSTIQLAGLIQKKTNVDTAIIIEFLRALFVLARDGKIPFAKWNPRGYSESTELRKTFDTEKGVLETVKSGSNIAKMIMVLAGLGISAYILSQLKRR